jgi:hypothetical protein
MIRRLIQLLFSHPTYGPQMIQRLSETWPIRSAARTTAYLILRGRQAIEESAAKKTEQEVVGKSTSFLKTFELELRKGIREKLKDRDK